MASILFEERFQLLVSEMLCTIICGLKNVLFRTVVTTSYNFARNSFSRVDKSIIFYLTKLTVIGLTTNRTSLVFTEAVLIIIHLTASGAMKLQNWPVSLFRREREAILVFFSHIKIKVRLVVILSLL